MKERKLASVDRISEGIIVSYTVTEKVEDTEKYHLLSKDYPLIDVGDYIWLPLIDGVPVSAEKDEAEARKRKAEQKALFAALLEKKKKL